MVKNPKPDPALYQIAAEKNGMSVSECITIEDTVIGVKAGVAANIKTIGFVKSHRLDKNYVSTLKKEMLYAGAHAVIEDMRDYLKFL